MKIITNLFLVSLLINNHISLASDHKKKSYKSERKLSYKKKSSEEWLPINIIDQDLVFDSNCFDNEYDKKIDKLMENQDKQYEALVNLCKSLRWVYLQEIPALHKKIERYQFDIDQMQKRLLEK